MQAWRIEGAFGVDRLKRSEVNLAPLADEEVCVDIKAVTLNYRDLVTVEGVPNGKAPAALIPCSDGAGIISAVGSKVTSLRIGDRVASLFFQSWMDGPVTAVSRSLALGGTLNGVLAEQIVLHQRGVVPIPDSMSFAEAASLPCAGLTAWRAVAVEAPVGPNDTVLVQGTGGVSIFALQFAKARGAKVIVTSSSDAKLERARQLGADHTINYRTTERWGKEAVRLTGGHGVDVVVEVGGENTLSESLEAVRVGGRMVVIGVLSGFASSLSVPQLFSKNAHMIGITVGSKTQFEDMLRAIEGWQLKPVVDQTFAFDHAPNAFHALRAAGHFGKLCISVP